ncbi:hypothetical protein HPB49_026028 [Dermacentor silvarum]|nr:hypothetical protein HPB49_026028 [Dermacentor silvarum]
MASVPISPDIICLQEIGKRKRNLEGYDFYAHPDYPQVSTFAKEGVALSVEYIHGEIIQHQIITIWPHIGKPKIVIVHIYSPPRDRLVDFEDVGSAAMRLASRRDRVLVLGDFNAQHSEWGYAADSPKGKLLLGLTERYDLTLLTRLDEPIRVGNSVSKDTSPFTNQADDITWTNLGDNLGSDHYILSLSVNSSRVR